MTDMVADVPTDAVVLHGRGADALSMFVRHRALHAIARALLATEAAVSLRLDGRLTRQAQAILHWLLAQSAEVISERTETIAFMAWLSELEFSLLQTRENRQAEQLLALLPMIFLKSLEAIGLDGAWAATLPNSPRSAPIGMSSVLIGDTPSMPATVEVSSGSIRVRGSDFQAELSAHQPASLHGHGAQLRERCFCASGIELFDAQDFPELLPEFARAKSAGSNSAAREHVEHGVCDALSLLRRIWPQSVPDLLVVVRGVVAITAPSGVTYSASAPAVPGAILLTVRENEAPEIVAECLIHEAAHVKLDTLWSLAPMLTNGSEARFRHPWREDMRPMRGVLLGAHAFLNVAEMDRRGLASGIEAMQSPHQFKRRREELGVAMATLAADAAYTPLGRRIHEDMNAVIAGWNGR
jgi:HEXXH motif-containing protein